MEFIKNLGRRFLSDDSSEPYRYQVTREDVERLKANSIEIFAADGFLGGTVEEQVFEGRLMAPLVHSVYQMDTRNNVMVKVRDVKIKQNAPVAVKMIIFYTDKYPAIEAEVATIKSLSHPNIVPIYHTVWYIARKASCKCYVIMELAVSSLCVYLDEYKNGSFKLSEEVARAFISDMINGLHLILTQNQYHDDVNQHNFLVFKSASGRPVVKLSVLGKAKQELEVGTLQSNQYRNLADLSVIVAGLSQCADWSEAGRSKVCDLVAKMRKKAKDPLDVSEAARNHELLAGVEPPGDTWPAEDSDAPDDQPSKIDGKMETAQSKTPAAGVGLLPSV